MSGNATTVAFGLFFKAWQAEARFSFASACTSSERFRDQNRHCDSCQSGCGINRRGSMAPKELCRFWRTILPHLISNFVGHTTSDHCYSGFSAVERSPIPMVPK
jgi:hypothetical protein